MKLLLLTILLTSQTICSSLPDRGRFICVSKKNKCLTFNTDNHLNLSFSRGHFHYYYRRCFIGFFCSVENRTDSVLHFDRRNFTVNSNQKEYELNKRMIMKNNKLITLPDTFSLRPGDVEDVYIFQFSAKDKMSYKEYNKLLANDTVNLIYSGSTKDTILRMVPRTE